MMYLLSFILGFICSFGQPPFNDILPSICALALFLHLLLNLQSDKSKTWFSYFFGYGYFIYSVHWFSDSLLTYGDELLWLMPFGLILMPAFFALYFALAGYLIAKYSFNNGFLIALIWLLAELVRSYLYIEFPWLLIGYIWSKSTIISQSVSIFGIWGLNFLTIIWVCAIKDSIFENRIKKFSSITIAFISFICCYIYGINHLNAKTIPQNITIEIVQPNIDPNINSRIDSTYQNLHKTMVMGSNSDDINYLIWPEGANLYLLDENLLKGIKNYAPKNGSLILSSSHAKTNPIRYWNSLFAIDRDGKIIDYYDKIHLVPLGEYIPFKLRSLLPFINKITPGETDFSSGNGIKTIKTEHPFLPSICYEDAFPENVFDKYTWIVNLTNDSWFGRGIGPYQHLSIAKFRSIEQGVPTARAALTGISAVIDSFGQIQKSLPLFKEGIIKTKLPDYQITYYHLYGNYMVTILVLLIFIFSYRNFISEISICKHNNCSSYKYINIGSDMMNKSSD